VLRYPWASESAQTTRLARVLAEGVPPSPWREYVFASLEPDLVASAMASEPGWEEATPFTSTLESLATLLSQRFELAAGNLRPAPGGTAATASGPWTVCKGVVLSPRKSRSGCSPSVSLAQVTVAPVSPWPGYETCSGVIVES
jgi:hypothetical protein